MSREERGLVEILLLLPPAALLICVARTVIGVPTFGTFAPALLGLAFLDLRSLRLGLPVFLLTVLVGWGLRHLLERFHLLLVPRVSAVLTLLVLFLLVAMVLARRLGEAPTQYLSLFPLVILTHLVERFWTVEAEDGTTASFRTLLGTVAVALVISLALSPRAVGDWLFRHPETLGVVLAAQLLLGRYTGYRLSELYRFQDLLREGETGGDHELAVAMAGPSEAGHPGDEPPQRGVPPGPQPPPGIPPGGPQEPHARPVRADRGADP
jgi:hypothetical protein